MAQCVHSREECVERSLYAAAFRIAATPSSRHPSPSVCTSLSRAAIVAQFGS
ncbi:MAG: hypothetical protein ACKESB_03560 [Candidatus Hodgkinia cicadicola]